MTVAGHHQLNTLFASLQNQLHPARKDNRAHLLDVKKKVSEFIIMSENKSMTTAPKQNLNCIMRSYLYVPSLAKTVNQTLSLYFLSQFAISCFNFQLHCLNLTYGSNIEPQENVTICHKLFTVLISLPQIDYKMNLKKNKIYHCS